MGKSGAQEKRYPHLSLSLLLPSSGNLGKIQEEARGQRSIAFQSTDREREEISSLRFRGTIEGTLGLLLFSFPMVNDPGAQTVKYLPAMQESRVQSLGCGNPLEKGMATRSSILAWGIPWTEEPGGLQSMGSRRVGHD